MCPDCKGTGVYVGLNATEPCKACGGKKPEPAPEVKYERVSDTAPYTWTSVTLDAKPYYVGGIVWIGPYE